MKSTIQLLGYPHSWKPPYNELAYCSYWGLFHGFSEPTFTKNWGGPSCRSSDAESDPDSCNLVTDLLFEFADSLARILVEEGPICCLRGPSACGNHKNQIYGGCRIRGARSHTQKWVEQRGEDHLFPMLFLLYNGFLLVKIPQQKSMLNPQCQPWMNKPWIIRRVPPK